MKACSRCKEVKEFASFSKASGKKSGLSSHCKQCASIARAAYYAANREKELANMYKWQAANKESYDAYCAARRAANKERFKEERAKHYAENAARIIKRKLELRAINPEPYKAYMSKWRTSNPEKGREYGARRKARKLAAGGSYTAEDIKGLMSLQRGKCAACKTDIRNKYHVDHVHALSKGGSNDRLNLQLLCPFCNISKHAKDPVEFMQSRGFLL